MKTPPDSELIKQAKALPPPHFGPVVVPLRLLPIYYDLWKIEPIPGGWKYSVEAHDHVLLVRKAEAKT